MERARVLRPSLATTISLCALSLGCGHATSIRHPLWAGVVDPNEVVISDWRREDELDLPRRTLEDTASLIELSPSRVCFHLTRWTLDQSLRGGLEGLSLTMSGDSEEPRVEPVLVVLGRRFEHSVSGTREVTTPGTCLVHALGMCTRWAVPPQTEWQPFDYIVVVSEATACCENDGVITPASHTVRLEVHGGVTPQRFEWSLDRPGGT